MMRTILTLALFSFSLAAQDAPPPTRLLRIYDVRDLCSYPEAEAPRLDRCTAEFARGLQQALGLSPDSHQGRVGGQLAILGTPELHERVGASLSRLRTDRGWTYLVETRILRIDPKAWPDSSVDSRKEVGPKDRRIEMRTLAEEQAEALIRAGKTLSAPRAMFRPREECSIRVGSPRRFVVGYDLEKGVEGHPDGVRIPRLLTVSEGLDLEICALPAPLEHEVIVDLGVDVRWISSLEAEETPEGRVHRVVQKHQNLSCCLRCPEGACVAVRGLAPNGVWPEAPEGEMVVMVKVTRAR